MDRNQIIRIEQWIPLCNGIPTGEAFCSMMIQNHHPAWALQSAPVYQTDDALQSAAISPYSSSPDDEIDELAEELNTVSIGDDSVEDMEIEW
jgi:hypothetical protein